MKVLVTGADGFIGRCVVVELSGNHEVYKGSQTSSGDQFCIPLDLTSKESIHTILAKVRPDAIINCAGIVVNVPEAYKNVEFTRNILEEIVRLGEPYPKVVVTGSASEYGVVVDAAKAVSEDTPLSPVGDYATSKMKEVQIAQDYAKQYGIDITVARIFNPIGPGMGDKFLLTSLLKQIKELKDRGGSEITLSRLDSKRDYVDVRDVASAVRLFIENANTGHHIVQNIGSGIPTTNGRLLDILLSHVELPQKPTIIETRTEPEPAYAARADISRITMEYGWKPKYNLENTIKDIIHG